MKILMVLTSHDRLGDTGKKTGFWLEEFTAPYYVFKDAGAEITLASPAGGQPPIDPQSDCQGPADEATRRFDDDGATKQALANTRKLAEVDAADFDAVFYPGGHGPLWDLAEDRTSIDLIEKFWTTGKPVAAVCHAPGVLRHVRADGEPLVEGRRSPVSATPRRRAVGLIDAVPFRVEDELKRAWAATMTAAAEWGSFVQVDGQPGHRAEPGLLGGRRQGPARSAASRDRCKARSRDLLEYGVARGRSPRVPRRGSPMTPPVTDPAPAAPDGPSFAALALAPAVQQVLADVGYESPVADPGRDHSAAAGRPRRARPGADRHRQDRRLRAADPVAAGSHARQAAGAGAGAHARAGDPGRRGLPALRRAHARFPRAADLRRPGLRPAAARPAPRRACGGGHARARDRSPEEEHAGPVRAALPGAGRGRRDAARWASPTTSRRC